MELLIASICKTKDKHIRALEEEYRKRFPKHLSLTIRELGGEKYLKLPEKEQQKKNEILLEKIPVNRKEIILLDEKGKEFSTKNLTTLIESKMELGRKRLVFAIGGPIGWSNETKEKSDALISLSKLTYPYQLARLISVEQLYRCYTITQNTGYHRE